VAGVAEYQDCLDAIGQRVQPMIAAATRASESQVSAELRKLEAGFAQLTAKASRVESLLQALDPSAHAVQKGDLVRILSDVERRWEQEIKAVKRELHQTILAHNHNADLMADHRTAIDKIGAEIDERASQPSSLSPEAEPQLWEQLTRVAQTLERSRSRDQDVDELLRRWEVLTHRLAALGLLQTPTQPQPAAPPLVAPPPLASPLSYGLGPGLTAYPQHHPSLMHLTL